MGGNTGDVLGDTVKGVGAFVVLSEENELIMDTSRQCTSVSIDPSDLKKLTRPGRSTVSPSFCGHSDGTVVDVVDSQEPGVSVSKCLRTQLPSEFSSK